MGCSSSKPSVSRSELDSSPVGSEVSHSELKPEREYIAVFMGDISQFPLEKFTCVSIDEVELCTANSILIKITEVTGKISGKTNLQIFSANIYKFYELP